MGLQGWYIKLASVLIASGRYVTSKGKAVPEHSWCVRITWVSKAIPLRRRFGFGRQRPSGGVGMKRFAGARSRSRGQQLLFTTRLIPINTDQCGESRPVSPLSARSKSMTTAAEERRGRGVSLRSPNQPNTRTKTRIPRCGGLKWTRQCRDVKQTPSATGRSQSRPYSRPSP